MHVQCFVNMSKYFSKWLHPFIFPLEMFESSSFSTHSWVFGIVSFVFLIVAILNRHIMVFLVILICISLIINGTEHLFICHYPQIPFGEVSVEILYPYLIELSLFFSFLSERVIYMSWSQILCWLYLIVWKSLPFHFLGTIFWRTKFLIFHGV